MTKRKTRRPPTPARRRCAVFTRRTFPRSSISCTARCFVTTYQAGKLVVLRSDAGVINTHFRAFNKPMGMAVAPGRLAIGTAVDVWEFRNVPAVAAKLDPPGKHDACYLPRSAHVTGDIQIHEMAYVGNDVLFVNTRFSCLATHDPDHSFAPSGGRSSSRNSRRTTAAISTASASSTASHNGSRRSAKPTRPAAGAKTKRAAAS